MRGNSEYYRQFMIVNPVRRNPKRKTTAALAPPIDVTGYTPEQLQKQFDIHVEKMGQPGEWADNMEVSAFASALNVHVRLWQADCHYTISPRVYYTPNDPTARDERPTLNIAYHVSLLSCHLKFFTLIIRADLGTLLIRPEPQRATHRSSRRHCQYSDFTI